MKSKISHKVYRNICSGGPKFCRLQSDRRQLPIFIKPYF